MQAALASAASFVAGGLAPLFALLIASLELVLPAVVGVTIVSLAALGLAGAKVGGAAAIRVTVWGSLAMAITFAAGKLFHASI